MDEPPEGATALLHLASSGDRAAMDQLVPMVYEELKQLASAKLGRGPRAHHLNTTALVHEAYSKLIQQDRSDWKNRTHFLSIAAEVIRRVLVDHVRYLGREKRGGGHKHVTIVTDVAEPQNPHYDLVEIDNALSSLERLSVRQAKIVELRYFAGMTVEECAGVLAISVRSVQNDWRMARAYLSRELSKDREQ